MQLAYMVVPIVTPGGRPAMYEQVGRTVEHIICSLEVRIRPMMIKTNTQSLISQYRSRESNNSQRKA